MVVSAWDPKDRFVERVTMFNSTITGLYGEAWLVNSVLPVCMIHLVRGRDDLRRGCTPSSILDSGEEDSGKQEGFTPGASKPRRKRGLRSGGCTPTAVEP